MTSSTLSKIPERPALFGVFHLVEPVLIGLPHLSQLLWIGFTEIAYSRFTIENGAGENDFAVFGDADPISVTGARSVFCQDQVTHAVIDD